MCGRIAQFASDDEIANQFTAEFPLTEIDAHYNGAPTQNFAVVTQRNNRRIEKLRWGLIPFWAKEKSIGNRLINARAETVPSKPSFRNAFKQRRCVVPVNGFFEWQKTDDGKIPHYISAAKGDLLAFAGLYEQWRDPQQDEDAATVNTFTIITTAANDFMTPLHDRMPLILNNSEIDVWLQADSSKQDLEVLLNHTIDNEILQAWPVSRAVNSPRNDTPEIIDQLK
jgi:putative SOS response-associated peptidase YedK